METGSRAVEREERGIPPGSCLFARDAAGIYIVGKCAITRVKNCYAPVPCLRGSKIPLDGPDGLGVFFRIMQLEGTLVNLTWCLQVWKVWEKSGILKVGQEIC